MKWKRASQDSKYAVEAKCTRCGEDMLREVKAGETVVEYRRHEFDMEGMCARCKNALGLKIALVVVPVALIVAAVLMVVR